MWQETCSVSNRFTLHMEVSWSLNIQRWSAIIWHCHPPQLNSTLWGLKCSVVTALQLTLHCMATCQAILACSPAEQQLMLQHCKSRHQNNCFVRSDNGAFFVVKISRLVIVASKWQSYYPWCVLWFSSFLWRLLSQGEVDSVLEEAGTHPTMEGLRCTHPTMEGLRFMDNPMEERDSPCLAPIF